MLSFFLIFFAPVLEFIQDYWVYGLGFFSQFLFGIRMLIQWYLSEKEGKVVSPLIFWQISVYANFLFLVYGFLQNDFVIILGQALAYIITIRNLQLEGAWRSMHSSFRFTAIFLPAAAMAWFFVKTSAFPSNISANDFFEPIFFIGAIGQMLLSFRFIYQWYYAEKWKTAELPLGFWYMTAIGSVLVVIYAMQSGNFKFAGTIYHCDPVLIFAQGLGLVASLRNIQLYFKTKTAE
jgi:lipid-A-disaccharide synthase-like uncharacterized protein